MEIKTPREFFEKIAPSKFNAAKAAGIEAVVQMNIAGQNKGDWVIIIREQKMEIKEGIHQSPAITIEMVDVDYVDLVNGKLSVERAFLTGKLKFKGNFALGLKLRDVGFM